MATERAQRPLVLPDTYSGDGSWDDWIAHFEDVAAVNHWDEDARLVWLKIRLSNRASKAFKKLPAGVQRSYEEAKSALGERFEPGTKRQLYAAELQARKKRKGEEWADFAEDLKVLVDKAYPDFEDRARERLALNHYLHQLDDAQVAFGVKQRRPEDLDTAVRATLELESYLLTKPARVASVEEEGSLVAAVRSQQDTMLEMIRGMMERLERLENKLEKPARDRGARPAPDTATSAGDEARGETGGHPPVVCRKCGMEGHYARGCATRRPWRAGN